MNLTSQERKYEHSGDYSVLEGKEILIGCSQGLWVLRDGKLYSRIHPVAQANSIYGISRDMHGDYWYIDRGASNLYKFTLKEGLVLHHKRMLNFSKKSGLKEGMHQIDFIDDELYIMDTYNNRCLICAPLHGHIEVIRTVYPEGEYDVVRRYTDNDVYKHFNSVYRVGDYVYMLAHNRTVSTRIPSKLYAFDKHTTRLVSIIGDAGGSAHNMVVDASGVMHICDSDNKALLIYDGVGFAKMWVDRDNATFTRGLAIDDDIIVVGGSKRGGGALRLSNEMQYGYLFVLNKDYECMLTIKMKECGQVHEVRMTGLDYGYSNTWRKD